MLKAKAIKRPRIIIGLDHLPTGWKPCLVSIFFFFFGTSGRLRFVV